MYTIAILEQNPMITNLKVNSSFHYEIVPWGFKNGAKIYTDRDYVFSKIPNILERAFYVKTANNDKMIKNTGSYSFLSFHINKPAVVYIAYDDRHLTIPNWLKKFSHTGKGIFLHDISKNSNYDYHYTNKLIQPVVKLL